MKVFFYGGCHAPVLAKLFSNSLGETGHVFEALENYVLIGQGTPFPYDHVNTFDAIVFSPIRNKGDWNTSHFAELLRPDIVRVTYPWLQWNGYFPGVFKPEGLGPHVWAIKRLVDLTAQGATVDDLVKAASTDEALKRSAPDYAAHSFAELQRGEAGLDIQISDFVETNFRKQRLFRTPDHPNAAIYHHVATQIAERLGLQPPEHPSEEPHKDLLPILPVVESALGLTFSSPAFAIDAAEPIGLVPLRSYLEMFASAYRVAHNVPGSSPAEAPPVSGAARRPQQVNEHQNIPQGVDPAAPAELHVLHVLEFGGSFSKPFATTAEACSAAAEELGAGHHSVSVVSQGYPRRINGKEARLLAKVWAVI